VCELGQVAGRPHAALGRNHREEVAAEQFEEPAGQVGADPGQPGRERTGAQQQQRPDGLVVERLPGGRRVRSYDRLLENGEVRFAHRRVGERAEPGVDAVHHRATGDRAPHDVPAVLHARRDVRTEYGGGPATGHRDDVLHRQGVAIDDHCPHM
jgi:hypothetical protein